MTTTDHATSMTTADSTRADAAAMLRALADLIETRPGIPAPGGTISFYLHGADAPAAMAAIASALPCQWQASISRREPEWLTLDGGAPLAALHGVHVSIGAPAADACTPSGAKTVTVWQPATALTGFLGTGALGEVA